MAEDGGPGARTLWPVANKECPFPGCLIRGWGRTPGTSRVQHKGRTVEGGQIEDFEEIESCTDNVQENYPSIHYYLLLLKKNQKCQVRKNRGQDHKISLLYMLKTLDTNLTFFEKSWPIMPHLTDGRIVFDIFLSAKSKHHINLFHPSIWLCLHHFIHQVIL